MYGATTEEAVSDATIITGTLLIHLALAEVLFDLGSTHTLPARVFIDRICVSVDDLGYELVVST